LLDSRTFRPSFCHRLSRGGLRALSQRHPWANFERETNVWEKGKTVVAIVRLGAEKPGAGWNRFIRQDIEEFPVCSGALAVLAHGHAEAGFEERLQVILGRITAPFTDYLDRESGLAQERADAFEPALLNLFV